MTEEELLCDNTAVGVIARDDEGRILMILREKTFRGYAPPVGHCEGHSYPVACFIAFEGETGLIMRGAPRPKIPSNPKKYNVCCREKSEYHNWQIFEVDWIGAISQNKNQWVGWLTLEEIKRLAEKTEKYLKRLKLAEQAEDKANVEVIKKAVEKVLKRKS